MAKNKASNEPVSEKHSPERSVSRVTPVPHRRLVTPAEAKKRMERRAAARAHAAARQDSFPTQSRVLIAQASEAIPDAQTQAAQEEMELSSSVAVAERPEARSDAFAEAASAAQTDAPDAGVGAFARTDSDAPGASKPEAVESTGQTEQNDTAVSAVESLDAPQTTEFDRSESGAESEAQAPEINASAGASASKHEPAGTAEHTSGTAAGLEADTDLETAAAPKAEAAAVPAPVPDAQPEKTTFRSAKRVRLVDFAEAKSTNRKKWPVVAAVIVALAVGFTALYLWLAAQPPVITAVDASQELNENGTVTLTVALHSANFTTGPQVWCALTETEAAPALTDSVWVKAENGVCSFDVSSGTFFLHAVDAKGNRSDADSVTAEANGVLSLVMTGADTTAYLAYGDTRLYTAEVVAVGDADDTVVWSSSDPAVASVEDGVVTAGESSGTAVITAATEDGHTVTATVVVTDLIQLPQIIDPKTVLPSDRYTDSEAHLLDDILFSRVEEAGGYGTRGAVVAATRLLLLEFPYRISYFFENGRMTNDSNKPQCDGEGRFSHRGLYLCECKFDELETVRWGPVIWGNKLINWQEEYQFVPGQYYPNGLDCSGFVCWCLVNGGYDFGDVGAGDTWRDDDLCDLGTQVPITNELMASGRVKAGDLIGKDGHIAIILGLDDENIYIAESLPRGVVVSTYKLQDGICYSSLHDYIMLMDSEYGEEGVYDNDPFA